VRDGLQITYYENGQLQQKETETAGYRTSASWYYESGQLEQEYYTVDQVYVNKEYYESGQLENEYKYKSKLDITYKAYHPNGQLHIEFASKRGDGGEYIDGPHKTYYGNGKLAEEASYKLGKLVRSCKFSYSDDGSVEKACNNSPQ
jgi:antitoxin component YwqK of YwqJK toxin-antitoxin module